MTKRRRISRGGRYARISVPAAVSAAVSSVLKYRKRRGSYGKTGRRKGPKIAVDLKQKTGRSYTKTMTKNKSELQNISQHNDLSKRFIGTAWLGRKKRAAKTWGDVTYRNTNQWVMGADQGVQVVDFSENILTRHMLLGNTSNSRFERFKISSVLDDLLTSAQTRFDPAFGKANSSMYIKEITGSLSLMSMSDLAQDIRGYLMTPVHDTDYTPVDWWDQVMTTRAMGTNDPVNATVITAVNAGQGAANYYDVGEFPFRLPEFRRGWRVLKKFNVVLQPGDQHTVTYKLKYNRQIRQGELADRQSLFLANLTVVPMFIGKAGLVAITHEGTAPEVAYGPTKFGVVHNYQMKLGNLPGSRYNYDIVYNGTVVGDPLQGNGDVGKIINDVDVIQQHVQI